MSQKPELMVHREGDKTAAIVLIHGFGGHPETTWGSFPKLLATEPALRRWGIFSLGYSTSLTLDVAGLWAADPEIITLGGLLNAAMDVPPLDRYASLAFVAHSMGGLMLQQALVSSPRLLGRTGHVILFGTPSLGLTKARGFASLLKRQTRDMAEGSPFITGLRAAWSQQFDGRRPFTFVTIAGDRDEFVPRRSSIDPFSDEVRRVVYGNHLQIVKPDDATHLGFKTAVKALCADGSRHWLDSALVAVESRQFNQAIASLMPHHQELDDEGLVMLALALDSENRSAEAIAILSGRAKLSTDPLGVLAGRIKRRWLVEHRQADGERSLDLYREGFDVATAGDRIDHEQAYYHAINVAFLTRALMKDDQGAFSMAALALAHCQASKATMWRMATEGEANLHLGNRDLALKAYQSAVALLPKPWEAASMYQQAVRVAELVHAPDAVAALGEIFVQRLPLTPVPVSSDTSSEVGLR